ncbi:MAG: hypothetical protein K9M81_00625 [Chthoniobacterales bacterium]|nr:hypothetical protein [Chthoniobacterales bacterium]
MQQRLPLLLVEALTRLFYNDHLRNPASQMDAALDSHEPSRRFATNQYEICGLTPF